MKAQSLLIVSLIAAGSFSSQVNAQELSLDRVLGSFINQAMVSTAHEVELEVRQAVANTAHLFEISDEKSVGQVRVTELVSVRVDSAATEQQHEITSNQD